MILREKRYFAKGKRGIVSLAIVDGRTVLVKERNPAAAIDTIAHEARMLETVNRLGVGPRYIGFEDGTLVREFIDGPEIGEWIASATPAGIRRALGDLIRQCAALDRAGIDKTEMNHPAKHILIRDGMPVQIDFERARFSRQPKNLTQLCQWLVNSGFAVALRARGVAIPRGDLLSAAARYKKGYDARSLASLRSLITGAKLKGRPLCGGRMRTATFSDRVYALLRAVPRGKVTTYKDLAHALGSGAYRAVGQAMRSNPDAPRTPCHRVVGSDGSIGGFNGSRSGDAIARKVALLEREGVHVEDGKVIGFAKRRHRF